MSEREETKEIEEKIIEDSTIKTKNNRKVNIDFDKIHEKNLQINKDSFEEIEEHKKENKINTSNKKKIVIGGIIGAVVLIILVVFSTIFALININNENIMNGVSISGIDVSGLSKDEAKGQIEVLFNEKLQKDISVKYEDYVTEINPSSIETKYNIDETLDEAYNIGRNSNIFINNYQIFGALVFKKNIDVECSVNEEIAATTIDNIGLNLPGAVIQTDYYIEESNLIIKKGKTGLGIDKDAFLNNIKNELNDFNNSSSNDRSRRN